MGKKDFCKKWGKWAISVLLYLSGIAYLCSLPSRRGIKILTYHRINDDSGDFLSVSKSDFEKHIAFLSEKYSVISLEKMIDCFHAGKQIHNNSVVVTFDDGYKDNYSNAFPILKKYDVPATIFLVYDYIGTKNRFDWCKGNDYAKSDVILNWNEIEEMSQCGISFGAHTLTHPILSQVSLETARKEIRESKRKLEKVLGEIKFFAYPRGEESDFNEDIKEIVRKEGYSCACTTIGGTNTPSGDYFELRRTAVEKEDASLFMFRLLMMGTSDIIIFFCRYSRIAKFLKNLLFNR